MLPIEINQVHPIMEKPTLVQPTDKPIHVLLCATGSVAAIKIPELIQRFNSETMVSGTKLFKVRVILTKGSQHFITSEQIWKVDDSVECFTDADEWAIWSQKGDPVLHIELRKWADILLIAPLDCNTLAKLSVGMCDNLVVGCNISSST